MMTIRRIIATVMSIILMTTSLPCTALAAEDSSLYSIRVSNGSTIESYDVITENGELFFSAEAYGKLTRYEFISGDGNYGYQLGAKLIVVDPKAGKLIIPCQQYTAAMDNIIHVDGVDYLPASQLLPWMNVACSAYSGMLEIVPDGISLWEIVSDFSYEQYMFNLDKEYGDSVFDIIGLTAMSVFDTMLNLRWDRLIPADGTLTGASSSSSLYDYECYKTALVEIAQENPFSYEQTEMILNDAVKANKGLDNLEDVFGIDLDKIQLDTESYLRELGMELEDVILFDDLMDTWQMLRESITSYSQVSKYIDILSVLKSYELAIETDREYRDYVSWLSEKDTGNVLFNHALKEISVVLDENWGAAYSAYTRFGSQIFSDSAETLVDAVVNNITNDTIINASNVFKNGFFGSLGSYMSAAKLIYSKIIPVASGYEGMAKAGVLEKIQDYCWSMANLLQQEALTQENIIHIRQSYLTALKASKKMYASMQDTMDVKILNAITVFDGERLLDYQFNRIDEKILQLVASADNTLNDSTDGKKEYQENLQNLFSQLNYMQNGDADALVGKWYLYCNGWCDNKGNWHDIDMYCIDLREDGSVSVDYGVVLSEYYEGYVGTWAVVSNESNQFQITLYVAGGETKLGVETQQNVYLTNIKATLTDNRMELELLDGDGLCLIFGEDYERDLSSDEWVSRQQEELFSVQPDASYMGQWGNNHLSDGVWERTLTIHSVSGNSIYFDLFYYRIANFTNQTAVINSDGTASFTLSDGSYTVSGKLAFDDNVTVYIHQSWHPYIDAGLMEYARLITKTAESAETEPSDSVLEEAESWLENIDDTELVWKIAGLMEKVLKANPGVYEARVLLPEGAATQEVYSGSRFLKLDNVQVNGYWIETTGLSFSADCVDDKVTFFVWTESGSTDIGWVYDWDGNLIRDYDGQTLSDYVLGIFEQD